MKKSLLIISGISLLLGFALLFDVWVSLRGDYGWRWPRDVASPLEWLPIIIGMLLYGVGAGWLLKRQRTSRWIMVWGFLGALILPFIFLLRWGDPLYEQYTRIASGLTSGPYTVANLYTPTEFEAALSDWTSEQEYYAQESISIHAALAPPGLPITYFGTRLLFEDLVPASPIAEQLRPMQCDNLAIQAASDGGIASAVLGMVSPLWAALAVFPLFWLTRRLTDETIANRAVLGWAIIPGLAMFTPTPNTVFPTSAILAGLCLWLAFVETRYLWAFAAGLIISNLTFFNISVVPILLLFGIWALGYHVLHHQTDRLWSIKIGLAFGFGLSIVWAIWILWGGATPWHILQTAFDQHFELDYPYLPWLALHLWDFTLFLGLPLVLLFVWEAWRGSKNLWSQHHTDAQGLLAVSLALTLLIMTVSGTARGETGRVWQFFFPFALIVAAGALSRFTLQEQALIGGLQLCWAAIMVGTLAVIGTGLSEPPQTPPNIESSQATTPQIITFGKPNDGINLQAVGGSITDTNTFVVDLQWQANAWQSTPYWISILPVAPDGVPYGEAVVIQPFEDAYPVTCWQPGQTVITRIDIPLADATIQAGDWWLSVSLLDYNHYEPQPVVLGDGSTDTQAGVGPIQIIPNTSP